MPLSGGFSTRFLGVGIGSDAVDVRYISPSGKLHFMTDAHNVFLNIAAQSGLVGLAAVILLIAAVAVRTLPLRMEPGQLIPLGLGLAWLNVFVYQGLTGSYEDARHLWLLLGLLIAAARLGSCGERKPDADVKGPDILQALPTSITALVFSAAVTVRRSWSSRCAGSTSCPPATDCSA